MNLNEFEQDLIQAWEQVLNGAKKTKNYDKHCTYGLYQIDEELNTYEKVKVKGRNKRIYDYPELNGNITFLKSLVKDYYRNEIVETLFEYEFLK